MPSNVFNLNGFLVVGLAQNKQGRSLMSASTETRLIVMEIRAVRDDFILRRPEGLICEGTRLFDGTVPPVGSVHRHGRAQLEQIDGSDELMLSNFRSMNFRFYFDTRPTVNRPPYNRFREEKVHLN
ncbi:hypothetical protein KM043_013132 [Ampulex compressa]|nr:hypothetical protein KM043_013132 [Ampulex compressa]